MTKIQFSKWISKLLTDEVPKSTEKIFEDVPSDCDGFNEINYLYENSVISLNQSKIYEPWSFITVRDASVMILRILGYERLCQYKGGYPNGYNAYALELGLYKNASGGDYLRRNIAVDLLYTAINASYMEPMGIQGENITYEKKTGILEKTKNISFSKGIVNATSYSGLIGEINVLAGSCYIGLEKFLTGDSSVENFLGVYCDYYYKIDSQTSEKTIVYIAPNSRVVQTIIETNKGIDLDIITGTKIKYHDEKDKSYEKTIKSTAVWIYNNKTMTKNAESVINPKTFKGSIRLIDNGSGIETLIVEQYRNIKIRSVDTAKKIIVDELTGDRFDFTDYTLLMSDGENNLDYKNIEKGSLAELYISDNNKMAVLLFGETEVTRTPLVLNNDNTIETDDGIYYLSNEFSDETVLGNTTVFHLNRHGEIVYSEARLNDKKVGILSKLNNENNKTFISIITATNSVSKFETASKIFIDGVRLEDYEHIKNGKAPFLGLINAGQYSPVLYRIDSENKLIMLDTVLDGAKNDKDTLVTLLPYNKSKYWNYKSNMGIFRASGAIEFSNPVKSDSTVILMNTLSEATNNCYMGTLKNYSTSEGHQLAFYSTKRNTNIADIVYSPEYTNNKLIEGSVVDSVTTALGNSKDTGLNVNVYTGREKKSYWISPENTTCTKYARALKKGDIISFYTNMNNDVDSFVIVCFSDGKSVNEAGQTAYVNSNKGTYGNPDLSSTYLMGKVKSIEGDYVEIVGFGGETSYWLNVGGAPITRVGTDLSIETGLSSVSLKENDNVFIRFAYSIQMVCIFDSISN